MEHTQSRENLEGNSSSRDNDQSQKGRRHDGGGGPRNRDEKSDIHLSKTLAFLLRHGAERQGYKLMPGGFLYVDDILQKQRNLQDYSLEDIQRIVKSNDKQRFFMEEDKETGKMKIRANHSLEDEKSDNHLSKALAYLLRHGAERQGYKLMPGGFLYVDDILQNQRNLQDYSLEDIQRIVKSNDKQRFFMEKDKEIGKMKIRANHSLEDEKSDIHLSKALAFLLRHGAERQGYKLMPGGFLYVDEILRKQRNLQDYSLEDIQRIVENDKQRFFMEEDKETGKMKIRANQVHSLQVENLDLKPLLSHEEAPVVIHGTYYNSWEKIKLTGLSRMGRNHIHFAAGEPGENGVISGMRSSCEVMVYINLQKALEGGLKFFWSANNVILSPGNEDGVIPPTYFKAAVLRNPNAVQDQDDEFQEIEDSSDVIDEPK